MIKWFRTLTSRAKETHMIPDDEQKPAYELGEEVKEDAPVERTSIADTQLKFSANEEKKVPSDRWRFYKDNQNCWRWKRTSKANGQCVGIAHEGYKNLADCTANAERNGYDPTRDEALTE